MDRCASSLPSTAPSTGAGKQQKKASFCRGKVEIVGAQVIVRNTKRKTLKGTSRISVLEKLLADKDVPDQYVATVQQAIAAAGEQGTGKKRKLT